MNHERAPGMEARRLVGRGLTGKVEYRLTVDETGIACRIVQISL